MRAAVGVTPDRPILIDRFLHHATECEADAISDGENVFVPAVMEHIELAGIHSGDSACILPSRNLTKDQVETIRDYTSRIAKEMHVVGLMNMQYAIEDGEVYVLEANPRASRTVPLVSKVCNIKMVKLATDIMTSYLTGPSVTGSGTEREEDSRTTVLRCRYSRSRCSRRLTRYLDRRCVPPVRFLVCPPALVRLSTRHRKQLRHVFLPPELSS